MYLSATIIGFKFPTHYPTRVLLRRLNGPARDMEIKQNQGNLLIEFKVNIDNVILKYIELYDGN